MNKTAVIIGFDQELADIGENLKDNYGFSNVDIYRSVEALPPDFQCDLYVVDECYCTPSDINTAWQPHVQAIRRLHPEAKILLLSAFPSDGPLARHLQIAFHEHGGPYEHLLRVIQELLPTK